MKTSTDRVDFSDVTTGRRLPPVHPGEILYADFLEPLRLSVYKLARDINVPRSRANDIVRGRRAITTNTALRLGRYVHLNRRQYGGAPQGRFCRGLQNPATGTNCGYTKHPETRDGNILNPYGR